MPGTYVVQNPKAPREPIFSSTALAMAASSMFSSAARERKTAVEESKASAMVAVGVFLFGDFAESSCKLELGCWPKQCSFRLFCDEGGASAKLQRSGVTPPRVQIRFLPIADGRRSWLGWEESYALLRDPLCCLGTRRLAGNR